MQSDGGYDVVIKVDAWSSSFDGASTETYALSTEENFSAASGPAFSVGTSSYSRCVGTQWTVQVAVNNTGDLDAHSFSASLTVPSGLSLVSGSNPQSLGTITSGAGKTASWVLQANQVGGYSVPVNVSSSSYGESFSASSSFSVNVSTIPSVPSLILPANGASTTDTTPDLDWTSVSGATSYQLQVAGNPVFAPTEIDTTTTDSEYTPTLPLSLGWHYWRVRGSNSCGDSSWSTVYEYWIVTKLYLPLILRDYP